MKTIYPVDGHYLSGTPAVPLEASNETAERLVRTGAFTDEGKGPGEPFVLDDAQTAQLDNFYDPPERKRPKALEAEVEAAPQAPAAPTGTATDTSKE